MDFDEKMPCPACPEGHDRLTFHSLGMVCGRCGQHTGNNNQGHYWAFCKRLVDESPGLDFNEYLTDFHFCCPDDCELA